MFRWSTKGWAGSYACASSALEWLHLPLLSNDSHAALSSGHLPNQRQVVRVSSFWRFPLAFLCSQREMRGCWNGSAMSIWCEMQAYLAGPQPGTLISIPTYRTVEPQTMRVWPGPETAQLKWLPNHNTPKRPKRLKRRDTFPYWPVCLYYYGLNPSSPTEYEQVICGTFMQLAAERPQRGPFVQMRYRRPRGSSL